ncbi:flavin reductase family protein [Mycobacterium sp. ITM-2016-00317]|uniref:flavin reductase family protein n=1 Tax=Mycobacterium sp. ITM-2016-00317 TaxID=2099694 RepID=UPI000D4FA739|nr:flavin reductase family protein [Mycobacterium sp. ITM-2016-00317]WNG86804.1 flavin reductase family protein [Mycobacterium sp. ITM-2016-00317]
MAVTDIESLRDAFRDAMASVCTPVAVITAMDGQRPHGTTVSAFASLSMSPPSLLVSLDRGSDLLAIIQSSGSFGVNVLGHDQSHLAACFARKGREKFADVEWSLAGGVPRLTGAAGWFACDVAQAVEAADHVVVIGEVRVVESRSTAPLTYHDRTFGTHQILG